MEDGNYFIDLPFKSKEVIMPNNRRQAEQRLTFLSKRFQKDENFKKDYTVFMDKVINEGYAMEVPKNDLVMDDGRVWYLPHHGV